MLVADLSSVKQTRARAEQANAFGRFDAVISNAAVGYMKRRRAETDHRLAHLFAINSFTNTGLRPNSRTCRIVISRYAQSSAACAWLVCEQAALQLQKERGA